MRDSVRAWLSGLGFTPDQVDLAVLALYLLVTVLSAWLANFLTRQILLRAVRHFARKNNLDVDNLVQQRFFTRLAHIAPALVIWAFAPGALAEIPSAAIFVRRASEIFMLLTGLLVLYSLISAFDAIYRRLSASKRFPITGILQTIKLVLALAAGLVGLSILLDKSPWVFLTGIGAVSAVVMLIFKDSILGFVGGITLAANDMVRPGDWIEMPKYGADGEVIDVALTTVKVRNFDKTITMVPTYALISDSFKNWRGMSESGGRRIKRAVSIDVRSICFCTPEMIERFSRIQYVKSYLEEKQAELDDHNKTHGIDESAPANARPMTNIGIFRAYMASYLRDNPKIHRDMTFLVRQLPPTENGLPLEICVFSSKTAWADYEAIQADIFDHIFAAIGQFDLKPFQNPTGADIADGLATLARVSQPLTG
jgi:miniconductance mechanosensitive channel